MTIPTATDLEARAYAGHAVDPTEYAAAKAATELATVAEQGAAQRSAASDEQARLDQLTTIRAAALATVDGPGQARLTEALSNAATALDALFGELATQRDGALDLARRLATVRHQPGEAGMHRHVSRGLTVDGHHIAPHPPTWFVTPLLTKLANRHGYTADLARRHDSPQPAVLARYLTADARSILGLDD